MKSSELSSTVRVEPLKDLWKSPSLLKLVLKR